MDIKRVRDWARRCDAGETSTVIAKEFGVTRNVVLGAVWRFRRSAKKEFLVRNAFLKKGDRVRPTDKMLMSNIHPHDPTRKGKFVYYCRNKMLVKVIRDGNVKAGLYSVNFWERDV